jgi:hypothetical protein
VLVSLGVAILTSLLYVPVKDALQRWTDRVFFGKQYTHRETLKAFSRLMTSILDLDALIHSTLELLLKALQLRSVTICLPDEKGNFYAHDSIGGLKAEAAPAIRLDKMNPLVRWLSRHAEAILGWQEIETLPEFAGLWQREKEDFEELGAQVLVGIKIQDELTAILVLSAKVSGDPYTDDDRMIKVAAVVTCRYSRS